MAYREVKVVRYEVETEDITPDMELRDLVDQNIIWGLECHGYLSKLDYREADDDEIMGAYNSTFKYHVLTKEDLKRIRIWQGYELEYEKGQAIALRVVAISKPNQDTRDFMPGEVIPTEWVTPSVKERIERAGKKGYKGIKFDDGILPAYRWRTKEDQ